MCIRGGRSQFTQNMNHKKMVEEWRVERKKNLQYFEKNVDLLKKSVKSRRVRRLVVLFN